MLAAGQPEKAEGPEYAGGGEQADTPETPDCEIVRVVTPDQLENTDMTSSDYCEITGVKTAEDREREQRDQAVDLTGLYPGCRVEVINDERMWLCGQVGTLYGKDGDDGVVQLDSGDIAIFRLDDLQTLEFDQ